jgi:hypothetical protein
MPSAAAEAAGAAEDAEAAEDAGAAEVAAAAVAVSRRGPVASAKRPVFAQMLAPRKRGFSLLSRLLGRPASRPLFCSETQATAKLTAVGDYLHYSMIRADGAVGPMSRAPYLHRAKRQSWTVSRLEPASGLPKSKADH